jgi:hypothetical protein
MTRLAVLLATVLLLLAGCGSPSADLFSVDRAGAGKGGRLRLIVSDGGTVRCNGGASKPLEAARLLQARKLARELQTQAALGLELKPGRPQDTTFTYRAELEDGTIAFADSSRGLPPSFTRLAAFTRVVARGACGLQR